MKDQEEQTELNVFLIENISERKHGNNMEHTSNNARKGLKNRKSDIMGKHRTISPSNNNSSSSSSLVLRSITRRFSEKYNHNRKRKHKDEIQGDIKKIKPPTYDGEMKIGEKVEAWLLIMIKYF